MVMIVHKAKKPNKANKPNKPKTPVAVRETAPSYVPVTSGRGAARQIPAGEFKARCLALMEDVRERGSEYIITKRGEPVAKLVPVRTERRPLLGSMTGTVTVLGDIVGPLEEPWDVFEGADDEP